MPRLHRNLYFSLAYMHLDGVNMIYGGGGGLYPATIPLIQFV